MCPKKQIRKSLEKTAKHTLLIKDLGTCQISGLKIQTFLHCSLREKKTPKQIKKTNQKPNLQQLLIQKNYVFITLP